MLFFHAGRKVCLYSDARGFQLLGEFNRLPTKVEGGRAPFKQ